MLNIFSRFIFLLFRHRVMHACTLKSSSNHHRDASFSSFFTARLFAIAFSSASLIQKNSSFFFFLNIVSDMCTAFALHFNVCFYYFSSSFNIYFYVQTMIIWRRIRRPEPMRESQNGRKNREIARIHEYTFNSLCRMSFIHLFCNNFMRVLVDDIIISNFLLFSIWK